MKDYKNIGLGYRLNKLCRNLFIIPRLRSQLKNKSFSLICNNCNGGFIYHDLGLQFTSPTINLYFVYDHFLRFLEDFDYYISQELVEAESPLFIEPNNSPICNLGVGEKMIELHFLHYHSFDEAKSSWEKRKARLNKDNMFIFIAAFDCVKEETVARFENLPFKNKIFIVERPMPQYKSTFCIKGYEKHGLGVLSRYSGLFGKRIYDNFDFVEWLNTGEIKKL